MVRRTKSMPLPVRRSRRPRPAVPTRRSGEALPLSALSARLDDESAAVTWLAHPDGVLGRVLKMPAGSGLTVPLRLGGEVSFSARAMLLPHDWRDRTGSLRARVAVTNRDGRRDELWSATLDASDRGRPGGVRAECLLP